MPKKVSPELRARAVRMVQEHQRDYPSQTAAAEAVARQLGLGRETVRRWVVQAEVDGGGRPGGEFGGVCRDQTVEGRESAVTGRCCDPACGDDFLHGRLDSRRVTWGGATVNKSVKRNG